MSILSRTMSWRLAAAAVAAAWACSAWAQTPPAQTKPAGAADPGAMVDSLFGPDIRRVQATPDRVDDMHLAKRMLEAARLTAGDKAVVPVLCRRVFDLAENYPPAHEVALDAAELAGSTDPACRGEFDARSIKLLQRRYSITRGDERVRTRMKLFSMLTKAIDAAEPDEQAGYIRQALAITPPNTAQYKDLQAKLRDAVEREQIGNVVKKLQADLSAKDDPPARSRLVMLLLLDLDLPAKAAVEAARSADEFLKTYVPLAAQNGHTLAPAACLELGDWYRSIVEKAQTDRGKAVALNRSANYYQLFLDRSDPKEANAIKARLAMGMAEAALKQMKQTVHPIWQPAAGSGESPSPPAGDKAPSGGLVFSWAGGRSALLYGAGEGTAPQRVRLLSPKGEEPTRGELPLVGDQQTAQVLLAACKKSNQFALSVALRSDDVRQGGPARIVSFSNGGFARNFTLGQEGESLILRLRTASSGLNGMSPQMVLGKVQAGQWLHVAVSYAPDKLTVWLNGRKTMESDQYRGGLASWEPMTLILGDEVKDPRPWKGRVQGLHLYCRTLSESEVAQQAKPFLRER